MLEISYIRENKENVIQRLAHRGFDGREVIEKIAQVDENRRKIQTTLDGNLAEANQMARKIGELFKSGQKDEANTLRAKTGDLKESNKKLETEMHSLGHELQELMYHVPNLPHELVPSGKSAEENELLQGGGSMPELSEDALPHWDLAKKYELIDFELGVKISGAGFPVYTGKGARLQRALINFFLDQAQEAGYKEVQPPLVINEASGLGTGQLPDKEGQMYHMAIDDLYLIPTGEVPLTNIYRDVRLNHSDFPIKISGYTPCFRREAGSYGRDVRGLNRLHQFDKVEIVQLAHPDKSYELLDEMVAHVKHLLDLLELPYRVARLCSGDLGFTSALTYDMEVYSAAQQKWLEVSSISNFETFQANRLKLRFKDAEGKSRLAHTLNGSALALPRIVAALLENNQTETGIRIPKALVPYTGFDMIN